MGEIPDMNLPPFKVVCISDGDWLTKVSKKEYFFFRREIKRKVPGPEKNEICIVDRRHQIDTGIYYTIRGYERYGVYNKINFAPIEENLQSISLSKILEEETKFVSAN